MYKRQVPNRGKRNSSLYLPEVVKTIAEIKGISCEEVVAVTESNAMKVLNLICLLYTSDLISIGNIMLLIPGIAFTNSLRDMFSGDTITGLIRCMEALLLALVVGLGLSLIHI